MAWDSSRPVPWQRLMREWVIYAGIMAVLFVVFFRDGNLVGALAGLFISGPLYVVIGAILAKFGYTRRSMKELREEREEREERSAAKAAASSTESQGSAPASRRKPPPTRRTSQGSNRPGGSKRKRR